MNTLNRSCRFAFAGLVTVALAASGFRAAAALATAWHIPDGDGNFNHLRMRNPEFEIGTNTPVAVWSGVWKWSNGGATENCNQTGGWVIYKGAAQSSWSSNALSWQTNFQYSTGNQYWSAAFNSASFGGNEVIQYYLLLTFTPAGGITVTNLYLYAGGDCGSLSTSNRATAAASPFTVRNRPAWLFHGGNRVISPGTNGNVNNVECWVKAGYLGKDDSAASRYADQGRIYYTLDGSTPAGALGVGSGATQVAPLSFDHRENDPSPAGNAMWWKGTLSNAPLFTTIKYKLGLWHGANNEEKFADYNAASNNSVFSFSMGTAGDPVLTVNQLNADYTTTHVFVDEVAGDAVPLNILFTPNAGSLAEVEVFSNLNNRDRATLDANGDGIEDGIIGPDGNHIVAGVGTNYYQAHTMTPTGTPGQYALTLNAQKTGAYRLTARYKVAGNTNWFWYSSNGRRDHAVVVSPKKSRDIVLYELNTLNVESQGTGLGDRSTFVDLWDGPGARAYNPVSTRFNLGYVTNLGVNWLWFQPIHPPGIAGRETDPATGQPYEVGSPYAVKNFFEVSPLMSKNNTRAGGLAEFTNFVAAADAANVNVMLDAAFNHTAFDCELAASGVYYFKTNGAPADEIRNSEARFHSRTDAYDLRASGAGNIAAAPDRYDFGKWNDVKDVYFGRYAALVGNSGQTGNQNNEGDWLDTSINKVGGVETGVDNPEASGDGHGHFDQVTQNVWRYFSDYILYWLDRTGCPAGTPANQTGRGIDGLRADFGQGLPPQCWEYIINKARSRKWDFVFMSESLDGGAVTYRSNRHFDMLNENIVFALKSAANASDYRSIFESRRTSYGQGLVLLNTTSHDEEGYDDPFQALIRYTVGGSLDGAPMLFYGQELGSSRAGSFDRYESNFGKLIPHFKKFNSLQPLFNPAGRTNGQDYLYPVYAGINQARQFSRALRSSNRWFLDQTGGGGPQPQIHSVAKYETANASPNQADVVFAFANLDRHNPQAGSFNVNITQNGSNLFGIKPGRIYNVKNLAAYTAADPNRRNYWLWGAGVAGSNALANGVFVSLNQVPASDAAWATAPFEAQYLKLYDVTPPPAPATVSFGTTNNYVFTNVVTFTWPAVSDPEGGIAGYQVLVGTAPGASNVFAGIVAGTSLSVTSVFGVRLYATIRAVNNAAVAGAAIASSSVSLLHPSWIPVASMTSPRILSWSSVSGRVYQVWSGTNLLWPFAPFGNNVTGMAPVMTLTNGATEGERYFKVQLLP